MKILITGTSQGIGKAIAERFLKEGHNVIGIDRQDATIEDKNYVHHRCDVCDKEHLPQIDAVNILINTPNLQTAIIAKVKRIFCFNPEAFHIDIKSSVVGILTLCCAIILTQPFRQQLQFFLLQMV